MSDLVTFGETMLRFAPPGDERIETADEYRVRAAGAESNVAVAAQRLGLDATWTSKLPDNPAGRRVAGELRTHGVSVDVTWAEEGRQGTYYLETGEQPRGNEVIYDRVDAAVRTATPGDLARDAIETADCVHTTGITPALSETLAETTATLLSTDATTSFDVNYRSKLWSPGDARETLEGLLPLVDVCTVAERDARDVLGIDGDPAAVATTLADTYDFEVTVLTRGAEGALAYADGSILEQPAFESTDTHPVGTGDSFVGGFLARYVDGAVVRDALEFGAATAALKRSIPGDIAVLSPPEVEAVIDGEDAAISR